MSNESHQTAETKEKPGTRQGAAGRLPEAPPPVTVNSARPREGLKPVRRIAPTTKISLKQLPAGVAADALRPASSEGEGLRDASLPSHP